MGKADELADLGGVFEAGGEFEAAGGVDAVRIDDADGGFDVVGPEASGEDDAAAGRRVAGDIPVERLARASRLPFHERVEEERRGSVARERGEVAGGRDAERLDDVKPVREQLDNDVGRLVPVKLDDAESDSLGDLDDARGKLVDEDADGDAGGLSERGDNLARGSGRDLPWALGEDEPESIGTRVNCDAGVGDVRDAADLRLGHSKSVRCFHLPLSGGG